MTTPGRDPRRMIYAVLDLVIAALVAFAVLRVVPNRLPLAQAHLLAFPCLFVIAAAGSLWGGRRGWWMVNLACAAIVALVILLIVRVVASVALMAGVYGAYGQAASMFAVVAVCLVVQIVGLVPVFQWKYVRTRAGRRAFGVDLRAPAKAER